MCLRVGVMLLNGKDYVNGIAIKPSIFFKARRNARIASVVLATAVPSVCLSVCPSVCQCPSVTRRYCVKTTARTTVQFALLYSEMCLVL